jgi:hypothetical protein
LIANLLLALGLIAYNYYNAFVITAIVIIAVANHFLLV